MSEASGALEGTQEGEAPGQNDLFRNGGRHLADRGGQERNCGQECQRAKGCAQEGEAPGLS